jgi:hypothetical protein
MKWPEFSELEKIVPFPEGCSGQRLRREEIPLLIASIQKWYPDVSVGGANCQIQGCARLRRGLKRRFTGSITD